MKPYRFRMTSHSWEEERDLEDLLLERFKSRGRVRELKKSAPEDLAEALCVQLFRRLEPAELQGLTLSRLLINCYLAPFTRSQPMDIDAVILKRNAAVCGVQTEVSRQEHKIRCGRSASCRSGEMVGHLGAHVVEHHSRGSMLEQKHLAATSSAGMCDGVREVGRHISRTLVFRGRI